MAGMKSLLCVLLLVGSTFAQSPYPELVAHFASEYNSTHSTTDFYYAGFDVDSKGWLNYYVKDH